MNDRSVTLDALSDRIRYTAIAIARSYGPHIEADDVESEMTLAILERYADEPEFLDQSPSYIVTFGAWRAKDVLDQDAGRNHQLIEADDPETAPLIDIANPSNPWPQVDLRLDLEQVICRLDGRVRLVAAEVVFGGGSLRDIGARIGVSRETVRKRLGVMRAAMV